MEVSRNIEPNAPVHNIGFEVKVNVSIHEKKNQFIKPLILTTNHKFMREKFSKPH